MKNKAQSFKKALSHLTSRSLCQKKIVLKPPYSVYWGFGSDNFNVTLKDEEGFRVVRLGTGEKGRWVLKYENRRGRKLMETLMVEPTEKEFINLGNYFEDSLEPTDEEAGLFCLLFANLSGFLIKVSNRILEEEGDP